MALCMVFVGCSSLKFAHGFLKTMVRERVETYLDIHKNDNLALESEISALVSWHRIEMLPKYAVFFKNQAQLAEASGWNQTQVDEAVKVLRGIIKDTSQGSAPFIAKILVNHTSETKVNHIQAAMDKVLSKRRELYNKALTDQIDAAIDKSLTNLERFFGTLTEEQIEIIREHKVQMYDPTGGWLDWRDKRQRDLTRFLRTEPLVSDIEDYVKVALTTPEKIFGQAYRDRADQWWNKQAELLYDLMTSLDIDQRQTLASNLHGYAIDMVELANAQ